MAHDKLDLGYRKGDVVTHESTGPQTTKLDDHLPSTTGVDDAKTHGNYFYHRAMPPGSSLSDILYRHYQSFDQIIIAYQTQNMLSYLRRLPRISQVELADLMMYYFENTKLEAETYQLLIKNGQLDVLLQTFQTVFQLLIKQDRIGGHSSRLNEPYYLEYFSGAVINITVNWVKRGFVESPRYLGQLVARFTLNQAM